jgi:hypothetical protein
LADARHDFFGHRVSQDVLALSGRRPFVQLVDLESHMKKSLAIVAGTIILLATGTPLAQDMKMPASHSNANGMQYGSSMEWGGQMVRMDDRMKKMQTLRNTMTSATTPEEHHHAN